MKTKHNLPEHTDEGDNLPPMLQSAKQEKNAIHVPDGYFDSLVPCIIDKIKLTEKKGTAKSQIPVFRKPVVWLPVLATTVIGALFLFVIPAKNELRTPATTEWDEINLAYDASYAEEVLVAESYSIDLELETTEINFNASTLSDGIYELNDEEVTTYLKEQEIDIDMITEN